MSTPDFSSITYGPNEIDSLRAQVMTAEAHNAVLSKALVKSKRKYFQTPVFKTFCELKHGIVGDVLGALQEGAISRGKAAELLAEIAHGATEVQLPDCWNLSEFPEDETPRETLHGLQDKVEALTRERDAALFASRHNVDMYEQAIARAEKAEQERDVLKAKSAVLDQQLEMTLNERDAFAAALDMAERERDGLAEVVHGCKTLGDIVSRDARIRAEGKAEGLREFAECWPDLPTLVKAFGVRAAALRLADLAEGVKS